MSRIVIAGARGFFGSHVHVLVAAEGRTALAASRRPGLDLCLDVEDRASIRAALRSRDIVIDAAGPFQSRTTTLVEEAIAIGCDVIDLCDSLVYARRVAAWDDAARGRGARIFNCCSAVSVLSAFAIDRSGVAEPEEVNGFLAPATRRTVNRGVAESFLASVGRPIEVWRDSTWTATRGWSESREFLAVGRRGRLIESADGFTLPRAFPSLRDVAFWVDPNTRGAAAILALASRVPAVAPLISAAVRYAGYLTKLAGRDEAVLAYDVRGGTLPQTVSVIFRGRGSFLTAVIPAALAAGRFADGLAGGGGVIPVNQQLPRAALLGAMERQGITIVSLAESERPRVE